jgi:DNA-binding beta-propeller fold protein YncE
MVNRFWVGLGLFAFIGASLTPAIMPVSPAYAAKNDVIATVSDLNTNPQGIAVSPDGNHLYVTQGAIDTVSVIETDTENDVYTVVGLPVTVGTKPDDIAVNPAGPRVYVLNWSSKTVSVIEGVYTSTSTKNSAFSDTPGIFSAVNGALVGGQVEGSPVYYGTDRVAVTSTYVLTVTAVSNVSPSLVTLAEGTIGADGSFSSMVRLPNLAPGTYNVRMTGEHTNGATLELTSQVTIDAGMFTSIGANIPVIR